MEHDKDKDGCLAMMVTLFVGTMMWYLIFKGVMLLWTS